MSNMINKICLLLTLLIFAWASPARAEGGCPPGQYPQQGQGWQTCAPIPGYEESRQAGQAQPVWQDRWGAIAADGGKGVLGTSDDNVTKEGAIDTAIADCTSKGGSNCQMRNWYRNSCGAMAIGEKGFGVAAGATKDDAIAQGLIACQAHGDSTCVSYHWSCSLPARIQ